MQPYQMLLASAILSSAPLLAQLAPPNQAGVTMGHLHLTVTDVDAQKRFWISMIGGKLVKNGSVELIQFPGVYIMLTKGEPSAPSAGSVINHFGFVVKDMPGSLAKWKVANLKIEPTQNPNEVFVEAPDGIRLEVWGVPELPTEVQISHLHYSSPDIPAMRAWYAKNFGAVPGQRACVACLANPRTIETGELPGNINLSFGGSGKAVAPTKGRTLDHIGFEVKNLEHFIKTLEAEGIKLDVPARQVPYSSVKSAFLTDPWGTYIELTEGLVP